MVRSQLPRATRAASTETISATKPTAKTATATTAAETSATAPATARTPTSTTARQIAKHTSPEERLPKSRATTEPSATWSTSAASTWSASRCGGNQNDDEHNKNYAAANRRQTASALTGPYGRLLLVSAGVCISLIDAFDTKPAFGSDRGNVGLDRVIDPLTVVSLSESRHQPFALYLTCKAVRQIAFEVLTDERVVLPILNGDDQQEARCLRVFWSNTPSACDCQRIVEDILFSGCRHG